jgi:hypothetical protein
MPMNVTYALSLFLLAGWAAFTLSGTVRAEWPWSIQRWNILGTQALLTGGCVACALGLLSGDFRAWLLVPIAASVFWMVPFPCYFAIVNEVWWVHFGRNVLFVTIGLLLLMISGGIVPLSAFGL